jgi:hypothetical protein
MVHERSRHDSQEQERGGDAAQPRRASGTVTVYPLRCKGLPPGQLSTQATGTEFDRRSA